MRRHCNPRGCRNQTILDPRSLFPLSPPLPLSASVCQILPDDAEIREGSADVDDDAEVRGDADVRDGAACHYDAEIREDFAACRDDAEVGEGFAVCHDDAEIRGDADDRARQEDVCAVDVPDPSQAKS